MIIKKQLQVEIAAADVVKVLRENFPIIDECFKDECDIAVVQWDNLSVPAKVFFYIQDKESMAKDYEFRRGLVPQQTVAVEA